ncbi:MAG: hypothetical protein LBO04_07505 [Spirochaetaceae bacterium]|jgi:hypothetical protein|nr:hypothetical protein [Spirochaetaceae bacterium]
MAGTRAVSGKDLTGKIPGAVEVKGPGREEVLGEGGLLKKLTGRLLSGILEAEFAHHRDQTVWRRIRTLSMS